MIVTMQRALPLVLALPMRSTPLKFFERRAFGWFGGKKGVDAGKDLVVTHAVIAGAKPLKYIKPGRYGDLEFVRSITATQRLSTFYLQVREQYNDFNFRQRSLRQPPQLAEVQLSTLI